MLLYLIRHGIAVERSDPACPADPERFLTDQGVERTRQAAGGLRRLETAPDLLVSSPYVRALQTAEITRRELGLGNLPIEITEALLPGADPADLWEHLGRRTFQEAVCFGHAPNLDLLISETVGVPSAFTSLKKAGAACLELDRLPPRHGRLRWLMTSRALRMTTS